MINLFENTLDKEYRTKISTEYYDKYNNLRSKYTSIIIKYIGGLDTTKEEIEELRKELDKLGIQSSNRFFNRRSSQNGFTRKLDYDMNLDCNAFVDKTFAVNRYNIERIIVEQGIININLAVIIKKDTYKENIVTDNINKFIVRIINTDGKVSPILFVKHSHSLEFYDILNYKTIAFKNFRTGRVFQDWNDEYEELALKIYSAYIDITKQKIENTKPEIVKKPEVKKEVTIKEIRTKLDNMIDNSLHKYRKHFGSSLLNEVRKLTKKLILGSNHRVLAERVINNIYDKEAHEEMEYIIPAYVEQAIKELADYLLKYGKTDIANKMIAVVKQEEQIRKENVEKMLKARETKRKHEEAERLKKEEAAKYSREYSEHISKYRDNIIYTGLDKISKNLDKISEDSNVNRIYGTCLTSISADTLGINNEETAKTRRKIYKEIIALTNETVDKDKLSKLISEFNKTEVEKYLKECIVGSFVRLQDRKKLDTRVLDGNTISYIREEAKKIGHINWNPNSGVSVERNQSTERGYLEVYGGITIEGGDNDINQTQLHLKIIDEAVIDLCKIMGTSNPTSSQLNKFLELNILHSKSQRPDVFEILPEAIDAYLLNRNKKHFSMLDSLDKNRKNLTVYIPCEYYAYIKEIFNHNQNNGLLKRNYTAVLNIVIYDFLIRATGKNYIQL